MSAPHCRMSEGTNECRSSQGDRDDVANGLLASTYNRSEAGDAIHVGFGIRMRVKDPVRSCRLELRPETPYNMCCQSVSGGACS